MTQTINMQYIGRAMNAVQDFLIQKLLIPKIYFDAKWNGVPVSVLAIDRAGSGDVHAVWFAWMTPDMHIDASFHPGMLPSFQDDMADIPGHYRYLAIVSNVPCTNRPNLDRELLSSTLAPDGVGRGGILYVDLSKDDPTVTVLLKAERFRSSKELEKMANHFVATNTPNWQIPDEDRL